MNRKQRMAYYVENTCKMLQRLKPTQANELEMRALYNVTVLSHNDIAEKLKLEVIEK